MMIGISVLTDAIKENIKAYEDYQNSHGGKRPYGMGQVRQWETKESIQNRIRDVRALLLQVSNEMDKDKW